MARERKQEEESSGGDWMNTYADLVTLLFAFFVLLFALSQTDEGRMKAFMAGFDGGAGILDGGTMLEFEKNIGQMLENSGLSSNEDLEYIQSSLQEASEIDIIEQLEVTRDERGIAISFMNNVLFDPGESKIKPDMLPVMDEMAQMLNSEPFVHYNVAIEGHTDSDPVRYVNIYPTNWELSTARATELTRYFVEQSNVEPSRLSASGYSYYHPVAPNDTDENKAKNRRVDIIILDTVQNESDGEIIIQENLIPDNVPTEGIDATEEIETQDIQEIETIEETEIQP